MRVGKKRLGNIAEKSDSSHSIGHKEKTATNEVSFANILELKKAASKKEDIFHFISSLDFWGEQLKKQPSIENYNKYRNQIQKILKITVPNTFGIEKTFSRPTLRNPRSREFHLLNTLDREMEALLKMIKKKEKNRLMLASKVVNIKGLVIDLLS